ncbi:hypothetical protein RHIZ404_230415 [Rhizobium sp. EC-SD404]|nr:hypothetical protein RHIZ404_230415 [Rhizobium sp. EC-SD404]
MRNPTFPSGGRSICNLNERVLVPIDRPLKDDLISAFDHPEFVSLTYFEHSFILIAKGCIRLWVISRRQTPACQDLALQLSQRHGP